jgi:hypothetical protein
MTNLSLANPRCRDRHANAHHPRHSQPIECADHLTGGCSMLPGICELAEEVFGIPAPRA